jgi:nucleoside 2-deoxyribosyltransferase
MKVYLAGAITGLSWAEATEWRITVTEALKPFGVQCYSPLRFKTYLTNMNQLSDNYPDFGLSTPRGIMTRDRWDATRCDVCFVNLLGTKKVSIGTVMEIAWADAKRIPVVLVMEKDNPHQHSMITEAVGFVCETLEEGINITKALLLE